MLPNVGHQKTDKYIFQVRYTRALVGTLFIILYSVQCYLDKDNINYFVYSCIYRGIVVPDLKFGHHNDFKYLKWTPQDTLSDYISHCLIKKVWPSVVGPTWCDRQTMANEGSEYSEYRSVPRSQVQFLPASFYFQIFYRVVVFKIFSLGKIFQKFLLEFFKNDSENCGNNSLISHNLSFKFAFDHVNLNP